MLAVLDSAHCLDVLVVPTSTPTPGPDLQACCCSLCRPAPLPQDERPSGHPTVLAATSHQGILLH